MVSEDKTKKQDGNPNVVQLRVTEALQDDAYKGIARIDPGFMKTLGVERGDIIVIKGSRESFCVVDRSYPSDLGSEMIRIDGISRKNARTGIGDMVDIKKAKVVEAKKITIAPAQQGIMVRGDPEGLKRGLLGKPVVKGDLFVLGGSQRRKDLMSEDMGDFFGDIGSMFNQMGMGGFPTAMSQIRFVVVNTTPRAACIITENTQINLSEKAVDIDEESIPSLTYEDIGGLKEEVKKVRELVELPLKRPEIFSRLGIDPPKGVLLHGPPGTGKTLLARAVANETEANFIVINGPEIMSKFYGDSEKKIREIFDDAQKNSPSIIFIDEIDAIAPKREESQGEVERRVVSQLLTMMDGLASRGRVVVIGATNRPNAIDPALRRPGRFDREVEIKVPDKEGRLQVLKIHTRGMPLVPPADKVYVEQKIEFLNGTIKDLRINKEKKDSKDKEIVEVSKSLDNLNKLVAKLSSDVAKNHKLVSNLNSEDRDLLNSVFLEGMVEDLAAKTHGFVGADLESLAKEAAMSVLRENIHKFNLDEGEEIPTEVLESLRVSKKSFDDALRVVRPSAMREVLVETPNIGWSDVGGLDLVKQDLKEAVEWPLKFPKSFTKMGIRPPRGVLLYGPPGTGKTLLAKAVAKESEANFIQVKGPSLLSMWVGKSEEGIRKIFERARQVSPCVIFFDEIDSLASRRGGYGAGAKVTDNVLNQMLAEMDGIEDLNNVIVIGATNRPDMLDSALMRPGRFDRMVFVPVPEKAGRKHILEIHTKNMPIDGKKKLVDELSEKTEGYTGADLESLVREAAMLSLRENIENEKVKKKHFDDAMKKVKPSVTPEEEERYKRIEESYLKNARGALENKKSYLG
ncbi:AAA family ATPase [Candidatus Pacearchaeota archaeon]|nr:AAA family ATPase [Candidatus Pacearchaeota archaeon]|tara:strand:+ start:7013 stop:9580 length:2568 start_codon:yes stop_codon:yes gene_type:complete